MRQRRRHDSTEPARGIISAPATEASVLVVAEHSLVRAGLRALLQADPGLSVVAETADVGSATEIAASLRPDVVLLDAAPGVRLSPLDLTQLRAAVPDACVLCLSRDDTALPDGVHCIPPDTGLAELRFTLERMLPERCAGCLLRMQCPVPRVAAALSRRERQVAVRVARGMSSKQIAAALGIRLRTVNTYRESLARKLGASSPAVVTRYVLEHGLHILPEEQLV